MKIILFLWSYLYRFFNFSRRIKFIRPFASGMRAKHSLPLTEYHATKRLSRRNQCPCRESNNNSLTFNPQPHTTNSKSLHDIQFLHSLRKFCWFSTRIFFRVTNKLYHEISGKVANKNILSQSDLLDTWAKS